ncbi:30S ribosomal protein S6 [Candidatus Pelagibacter sp.]|jgi:small subunit ribosomal protein S6|nr:30S ribosomal protein S6 [Candidatus Pelagibacter sp.]
MNLYEHTIIARQDTSPSELKQLIEKYSKIVEKNDGEVVKTESWGLLYLAYLIKKNKKGSYIHFKIKGKGKVIEELEKNESIDKKLLRYLTVKVKNLDLDTNYFAKREDSEKTERKEKPNN